MALSVPNTGPVDFLTLANVFGLTTPPYSLSSLKRDGTYVPSDIPLNSNISTTLNNLNLFAFRGSGVQYTITLNNSTNVNLYTLFNSSFSFTSTRKYVKFTIPTGVTIGSTSSGTPALDLGQFPTGTIIEIENNGNIYGAGGTAGTGGTVYGAAVGAAGGPTNGGNGGDAIKADYLNQTVTIINNGTVYGGGGGGGGGRSGSTYDVTGIYGAGGTEQYNGYYLGYTYYMYRNSVWSLYQRGQRTDGVSTSSTYYNLNGTNIGVYFSGYWRLGNLRADNGVNGQYYDCIIQGTTGGAGGSGGIGNGYLNSSTTGNSGGTVTTIGATNGSAGGNGGNWGLSGSSGLGTNPGSGGSAGRYVLKGSANVTFTNNSTIAGLLA